MCTRPVWAEVDLAAIKHNLCQVRRLIKPGTKIMAVVKANAYGHGAIQVAQAVLEAGADYLAVAIVEEALELRDAGFTCPILLLGWTPPKAYKRVLEHNITLTVYNYQEALQLHQLASEKGVKIPVHLKIDTGMSRLGILATDECLVEAVQIASLSSLVIEGIYTHLSKADEKDKSYSDWQLKRFASFVAGLESEIGFKISLHHAANSAAILDLPEAHFDLVRPGIILYGLKPSEEVNLMQIDLKPALSLKTLISRISNLPKETLVSYGGIYQTHAETLIATIPIGYADGFSRLLSGKAQVLLQQQRLPVVGRICMDQSMINISGTSGVEVGDEVILIGQDQSFQITVDEIASKMGTINYEVVCMISQRVPRKYKV